MIAHFDIEAQPSASMRSVRNIHLLIDYLKARDPNHHDIGLLYWILSENPNVEANDQLAAEREQHQTVLATMNGIITDQANQIAVLKEKLGRFATPPTRMQS